MSAREPSIRASAERSVPDCFKSFDLSIERTGELYQARVTASPLGPRQPIAIDSAGLGVGDPQPIKGDEPTRDVRRRPVDRDDLRHLGEGLFRAIFIEAIAEAFRASTERAKNERVGLRVCIQLTGAPELATLPWEALWDPEGRVFLADQPHLSVVRTLSVPAEAPDVSPVEAPLRVLALLPEPHGEGKLSGAAEWQQIRDHLTPQIERGGVKVDLIKPPTLEALGQRIDNGPCHVLHIVAHGSPGDPGAGGLLKLEDASGKPDPVSGSELARALELRTAPRLVVLSACHGARAAVDDAFDGMAQLLLNRGIPAVVAMRTAITDAAAVSFAAALYRELATGRIVEAAMVEARRVLSLGEHRTEWATPVLYLRGENVRILNRGSTSTPLRPERDRTSRLRKSALPAAALVLAGFFGLWAWRQGDAEAPLAFAPTAVTEPAMTPTEAPGSDSCPPPLGLTDLRFVEVDPDVVNLGERIVIVDEAFCVGTKEVSRRDWLAVMGGELPHTDWPVNWPMTSVTPEDASAFLQQLGARDPGVVYRLPTAAEWELAARADKKTDYVFGNDSAELHLYGNCKNILGRDGYDGPAPIGSYLPNGWGLYDVHGNVAEWVQWPEDAGPSVNDKGQHLALRLGGSYQNAPISCAFGYRSEMKADVRRLDTGFRVVRELENNP